MNVLNGNQALGYCRIRLVETIGGANDDYGRTLRQRRVLKSLFNKYKSKNMFDLIRISEYILGYVKTNVTQAQIEKAIEDIVENKITDMDTIRIPVNGAYEAPKIHNGVKYPIVYDWDENIMELYRFIYLDSEEESKVNLEKYRQNN
jgi:anionic cell wall polymer biosynthesis LytR-Cps2A-Psr (LCP) family protein